MSAITLYSIASVLTWAKACEHAQCMRAEVIRVPRISAVTQRWTGAVDENGKRHLVAHWAKNG